MKGNKKFMALMMAGLMTAVSTAGCSQTLGSNNTSDSTEAETTSAAAYEEIADEDALLIGGEDLSGNFNPLFATSEADKMVCSLIFDTICSVDEMGELEDAAGHLIPASEVPEVEDDEDGTDGESSEGDQDDEVTAPSSDTQDGDSSEDGTEEEVETFDYQLSLNKGLKFSDGSDMTIDDVIFTWKLMADPYYEGSYSLAEVPVLGMQEYYYDTEDVAAYQKNLSINYSSKKISEEDFIAYLIDTKLNGWFDGNLPGDLDGNGTTWVDYLKSHNYDTTGIEEDPDALLELLAQCEYENYAFSYDPYTYYQEKAHADLLAGGVEVPEIEGIEKVDDYTCVIRFTSVDAEALRAMTVIPVLSKAYYGVDYEKGDITKLQDSQNITPMGSGAYTLNHYEGEEASLIASDSSRTECGSKYVKVKNVAEEDKEQALKDGRITVASLDMNDTLEAADDLQIAGVEGSGFYYFGINTDMVSSPAVREGLMYLIDKSLLSASQEELDAIIEAGRYGSVTNEDGNDDVEDNGDESSESQINEEDETMESSSGTETAGTLLSDLVSLTPQTWPMTKLSAYYPGIKTILENRNPADTADGEDAEDEDGDAAENSDGVEITDDENSDTEENGDSQDGTAQNEADTENDVFVEEDLYVYSTETARSKFGSAGYWSNYGELVKSGEQLKLNMGISEELPKAIKAIAYQLKTDLEDLGAAVSLKEYSESEMQATIPTAAFDMWIGCITDLTDYNMEEYLNYGADKNYFHHQNGYVKLVFEELEEKEDDADCTYLVKELLGYVMDANYCRPLCEEVSEVYVVNSSVVNWEGSAYLDEYDSFTEVISSMEVR